MCATGEIARGMAEDGLRVTAIDREPAMIAEAKKVAPGSDNPLFLTGDVTTLDLPEKDYDFAFIGTGDLHHLETEKEIQDTLTNIQRHLREKGGLALELFYPAAESWHSPEQRYDPPNLPDSGVKTWKLSESRYDADTMCQHIRQEVFIEKDGMINSFVHEFDLRLANEETVFRLLGQAGFRIIAEYGGFDFREWQPGAEKWIVESVIE